MLSISKYTALHCSWPNRSYFLRFIWLAVCHLPSAYKTIPSLQHCATHCVVVCKRCPFIDLSIADRADSSRPSQMNPNQPTCWLAHALLPIALVNPSAAWTFRNPHPISIERRSSVRTTQRHGFYSRFSLFGLVILCCAFASGCLTTAIAVSNLPDVNALRPYS